jgi:hypothetical protein
MVGVAAALASNAIPLATTVLKAPAEIANILIDTALALVDAAINTDGPRAFGALDLVQVLLNEEVTEQRGLILGGLANLINDVATAYAVSLPPPAESGASASGNPLLPITRSLERSLRITRQVANSTLAIVRTTADAQVRAASTAGKGLEVFAAANPKIELIPDWIVFILAQVAREATDGRHAVAQAITKAGEDLSTAAQR